MGCSSKTFDADANARAVQLVTEGYSYSQAGAAVGKTRNVVAGACHRAGVKVGHTYRAKRARERAQEQKAARKAAREAEREGKGIDTDHPVG
jgi:hypothetical protein